MPFVRWYDILPRPTSGQLRGRTWRMFRRLGETSLGTELSWVNMILYYMLGEPESMWGFPCIITWYTQARGARLGDMAVVVDIVVVGGGWWWWWWKNRGRAEKLPSRTNILQGRSTICNTKTLVPFRLRARLVSSYKWCQTSASTNSIRKNRFKPEMNLDGSNLKSVRSSTLKFGPDSGRPQGWGSGHLFPWLTAHFLSYLQ